MAKQKSIAAEMVETQTKLYEGAQELFMRLANDDTITPDEHVVFDALNLTRRDIERETGRVRSALEHRQQAGTPAEYQAAKQRVEKATEALRAEGVSDTDDALAAKIRSLRGIGGGPLLEQIAAAASQLEQLIAEVLDARKRLDVMEQARRNLTRICDHDDEAHGSGSVLLPEFVQRRYSRECQAINHLRVALRDAKNRKAQIEHLLSLPDGDREVLNYGLALEYNDERPAFIHDVPNGPRPTKAVHISSWQEYKANVLVPELAEIEASLPDLQVEYDAGKAKADQCRQYYLAS